MARSKVDFRMVRELGLAFQGVEEGTAYGSPALKVRGNLMACVPSHRSAEPDSLMVRVDFEDRAALVAEAPDIYYLPDHYVSYSGVLVRLTRVNRDALRDLLGMAYKFVNKKKAPGRKATRKPPKFKIAK